jgi:feruloyl esterase
MLAAGPSGATVTANTGRCTVSTLSSVAPSNTAVKAASVVAATSTLPQYCSVQATVSYPGNNIDFIVGFPTTWNEHFVWASQGGLAGGPMTFTASFLQEGYATGITDTGHKGDPATVGGTGRDPAFVYDINKFTDYGHRANKLTADAAKALIAGYYQSSIKRSIFNGCSNGGRSVMINAQRYPGQFDAYVVGAPFISETGSSLDWLHSERAYFKKTTSFMPADKLQILGKAVLAQCDADDGVVDGVVSNPLACKFDPSVLLCNGANAGACLTQDQVDAVKFWNTDWKNSNGEVVSRRWLATGEEGYSGGTSLYQIGPNPPPVDANGVPYPTAAQNNGFSLMIAILGDMVNGSHTYDYRTLNVDTDLPFLNQVNGVLDATDTDLMAAASKGAKFIFYQGWGDPALNPMNLIDYRDAIVQRYGLAKANTFMRVFMVPGMNHCGGGSAATDQFDVMMPAIEAWMDTGIAPEVVIASRVVNGVVVRTRPLCAYPKYARYKPPASAATTFGIDDAFYFFCADPTP